MEKPSHHDVDNLNRRIRKIEGQLGGIRRMIEADQPCDDIIIQLNSARAALQRISQIIIEDHLDHCVIQAIQEGREDDSLASMKRALKQYTKMG